MTVIQLQNYLDNGVTNSKTRAYLVSENESLRNVRYLTSKF